MLDSCIKKFGFSIVLVVSILLRFLDLENFHVSNWANFDF